MSQPAGVTGDDLLDYRKIAAIADQDPLRRVLAEQIDIRCDRDFERIGFAVELPAS
jgi:hypothetical protein